MHPYYQTKIPKYDVNSQRFQYYQRYLLQKAMSVFKWTIPDNWDLNYLLFTLYTQGYIAVADIKPYGVIPQQCTISGYNVYYNPSKALLTNPAYGSREIEIGKTGELLSLTPDFKGILDCVDEYAEMLANASCAVNTNLYNSRLAYVFYAKNKAQAESYKKMYDQIGLGEPAVFVDSKLGQLDDSGKITQAMQPFNAGLKSNYVVTDVLEDMRRIDHMFAQKVGLPNTNSEKLDEMTIAEVNKTDVESLANVTLWLDCIQEGLGRIEKLFGVEAKCELRFNEEREVVDNEMA